MSTDARQKRPTEIIEFGVDFTSRLFGETIIGGNVSITVKNALTDADATSTILVGSSTALTGNVLSGKFQAGAHLDKYVITFKTGLTTLARSYEKGATLEVTNNPDTDNLLATRDEVKGMLGIPSTDTSDDAIIDQRLLGASRYLRSRCAREFGLQTYVEKIFSREDDPCRLRLYEWPILKVDKIELIHYDGTVTDSITDTTLYKWDFDSSGEIFFLDGNQFYREPHYNVITYRAGYGKIPDDLRDACGLLTVWTYRNPQRQSLVSHRIGDFAETFQALSDLPQKLAAEVPVEFVESVVARYRRPDMIWMP